MRVFRAPQALQRIDAEQVARASLGGALSFVNVLIGLAILGIVATISPLLFSLWEVFAPLIAPLLAPFLAVIIASLPTLRR